MKDRYRLELEQVGPSEEELERLYDMIEGGTEVKRIKRLSKQAAVVLACAILTVIAAAAAAAPAVWEGLMAQMGAFAPYAQTVQGAVCRDQGIEVQVLSVLSDDHETQVYLSVQDLEGDRLNEYLTLDGLLVTGKEEEEFWKDLEDSAWIVAWTSGDRTSHFELISYDPETRTALFSASIRYGEHVQPGQTARLSLTGMTTTQGQLFGSASCASVTGQALESLPAEGKVIFKPSDMSGPGYTDEILPRERVVLAPGQTPMPIEGMDEMWISSMGFASDGRFHVRLETADGIAPKEGMFFGDLILGETSEHWMYIVQQTLVPGGVDILFPLVTVDHLEQIQGCQFRAYGDYIRPGLTIQGDWSVEFQLEHWASTVLDWTGELAGRQVRQVTVSPLFVTMTSNDAGGFHSSTLYAVKKDGTTVAAKPGTGRYSNVGLGTGMESWDALNTWKFQEPVDLDDLDALSLMGETIPVQH